MIASHEAYRQAKMLLRRQITALNGKVKKKGDVSTIASFHYIWRWIQRIRRQKKTVPRGAALGTALGGGALVEGEERRGEDKIYSGSMFVPLNVILYSVFSYILFESFTVVLLSTNVILQNVCQPYIFSAKVLSVRGLLILF